VLQPFSTVIARPRLAYRVGGGNALRWPCRGIRARRRSSHYAGQHRAAFGAPGFEHASLMHLKTGVTMRADMVRKSLGKRRHRRYDLWRKVGDL
jgi:hypothetical protein